MWAIFLRLIKDKKVSIIVYCLATALFVWMYVGMFPTISEQSEEFEAAFNSYPEEFFQAFNIEELSFDTIEKFLAIEQYSIVWPIMVLFFVISFAGVALSGAIERGVIENVLAKPVSRMRIFFGRYLAGLIALIIFTAVSIFSIIPLCELHNVEYNASAHSYMFIMALLFGWAVYSIAMMVSAMFSERSKTYMITGSTILLMYVANLVSSLIEELENLKYASFFYYFDYNGAIIHEELYGVGVTIFIAVAIVCTCIGALWFNKRDIAV
ncbi:MAG: ABC transporter permease subunit [Patescibacteria group bacterium]